MYIRIKTENKEVIEALISYLKQTNTSYTITRLSPNTSPKERLLKLIKENPGILHRTILHKAWRLGSAKEVISLLVDLLEENKIYEDVSSPGTRKYFIVKALDYYDL